jgi:hypothetical protein
MANLVRYLRRLMQRDGMRCPCQSSGREDDAFRISSEFP